MREPNLQPLEYATPTPKSSTGQLRRLAVGLFVVLAVMSVLTTVASLIARQDVLLSVRGDDKWEVTKAVARDMFMAVFWGAIATWLSRRPKA